MAWVWVDVTDEPYWTPDRIYWTGSSWASQQDGLFLSTLTPNIGYYDYYAEPPEWFATGGLPAEFTVRAIKVTCVMDDPPNDHGSQIRIKTTENQFYEQAFSDSSSIDYFTWSFTPTLFEKISILEFYNFGYYYEPGRITSIELEIEEYVPPPLEPEYLWTSYHGCEETLFI